MSGAPRQLLAYTFPPGSSFEGQLVGAMERIESGGSMRILDALFVARDADGELVAVSMTSDSTAGMVGRLLSFRLAGGAERRTATERVLQGTSGDLARSLSATLEPGAAVTALLVEHAWAQTLTEAIGRMGGAELVSEFVEAGGITEVWAEPPPQLAAKRSATE